MYKDKEKEKAATRERVRRFREKQAVATVTDSKVTPIDKAVTPDKKMVCNCQYFKIVNNQLVCTQCGKPAPPRGPKDKIRRGIETK